MSSQTLGRRVLAAFAVTLLVAGCNASPAALELPGIPMQWAVPDDLLPRLAAAPLTRQDGEFAASIYDAGGTSAVTVTYQPITGAAPSILMTVFWFPTAAFDAAQNPNEPPRFGTKVLERDGQVLAVAGPTDAMFDGEDGNAITRLYELMYNPNSWIAV